MTMVPSQTLISRKQHQKHQYHHHRHRHSHENSDLEKSGSTYGGRGGSDVSAESDIVAGPMAEQDESRTNSLTNNNNNNEATTSSNNSKDEELRNDRRRRETLAEADDGWLQLSIGGGTNPETKPGVRHALELELLPSSSSRQQQRPASFEGENRRASSAALMYYAQYPGSGFVQHHHQQHQEALSWGAFRPLIPQYAPSGSASSSSLLMQLPQHVGSSAGSIPYLARQFQRPSFEFRVVNPPRRPHSGIWFTLQASQNQVKEPFLPQISKSFLRIKDGKMTVRLLVKYLVNKLRLDSESEIEITCRGHQLQALMTLQHIRDNIWGPTLTLLQDSSSASTTDHLMVLHYSRSA